MLGLRQKARAFGIGLQHRVDQADIGAGRFLRHRAHAPGIGPAHLAVVGMQLAQDHLEQGGFARAIAADQADAAARGKIGGGAGQDFPSRDPHHDVVDRQHLPGLITCHGRRQGPWPGAARPFGLALSKPVA